MTLDLLVPIASSVHAGPGVYALLLGSGVSRSAEVPTGWDVVNDLVEKVAAMQGETPDDPLAWYAQQVGGAADYSGLLESLAPTAADRRNLLEDYFEPSADDRAAGVKVPTAAHRSIAALVAGGWIRVIVTTNFDRLLETAIREAGVEPVVVTNGSAAEGAIPLPHTRCTIIKLHGDYLDPNIKNTVDELDGYDEATDRLLDRVLDEYGLIVCGWSGDWDKALRQAILRAPNRRYATYWAHVSEPGELADELIAHRGALRVSITGADEFFQGLEAKVQTLVTLGQQPLSLELAVAELKRYLPDPVQRIRLHDLLMDQVKALEPLSEPPMDDPDHSFGPVVDRMELYEREARQLIALCAALGYHADERRHDELAAAVLGRLVQPKPPRVGLDAHVRLQRYVPLLCLYGLGIGALTSGRVEPLAAVLKLKVDDDQGRKVDLAGELASWHVLRDEGCQIAIERDGDPRKKLPQSEYLYRRLREPVGHGAPTSSFDHRFNELEVILGLAVAKDHHRGPLGRFAFQNGVEFVGRVVETRRDLLLEVFDNEAQLDDTVSKYLGWVDRVGW